MKIFLIAFLSSFISMLLIDGVWLGIMGSRFYRPYLGDLMIAELKFLPALLMYLIYCLGLSYLITMPNILEEPKVSEIFIKGMIFGFVAYGAYDLTNQATLKGWPIIVTIVDMLWGAFLTGVISVISNKITRYFMPLVN